MNRIPPQAIEYEQSILAGMLFDSEMCGQASEGLRADHFYRADHKIIFAACRELHKQGKPVDIVTVAEKLKDQDNVSAAYIAGLPDKYNVPSSMPYYIEVIRDKYARREAIKLNTKIQNLCHSPDGDIGEIIGDLQAGIVDIETDIQAGPSFDPYDTLETVLTDKWDRTQTRDPSETLGHDLTKFKTLSGNIDGIQPGFYVVAADTNAGKTAFLCNLTLDLLDTNPDLSGIYFSLDDNKDVILNRFLGIKTGMPLNQVQRPQQNQRHLEMLNGGFSYLFDLAKANRLFVRDASEIQNVEQMETEIKRRVNKPLFVIIDGLYNLDVGDIRGDLRKENIERANKLKAVADTYRIPVICTGELRKRDLSKTPGIDDLMETGKFAYNANLVLLIYPENWADYDTQDEPILNIKYAKNKLSHIRTTEKFKFVRQTSKIQLIYKAGGGANRRNREIISSGKNGFK